MISIRKRRVARGIGVALGAAAAVATLAVSPASASSGVTAPTGITVPAESTQAPAVLVASLEGRNEVAAGDPDGQALALIGIQGSTLTYRVAWRSIGTRPGWRLALRVASQSGAGPALPVGDPQ